MKSDKYKLILHLLKLELRKEFLNYSGYTDIPRYSSDEVLYVIDKVFAEHALQNIKNQDN